MTIAIGILAEEGLVMASDTEESTPSHKRSVSKIYEFGDHKNNVMLVAGAGPDFQIEAMAEILGDGLGEATFRDKSEIKKRFAVLLSEYHRQHVLCWPTIAEREDNEFQLIIGLGLKKSDGTRAHCLWVTTHNTIREVDAYASIGIGKTYANNLLESRVYGSVSTFKETMALNAIDVIRLVKRDVPGCGKETEVRILEPSGSSVSWSWSINEDAEKLFEEFDLCVLNQLSAATISDSDPASEHEKKCMADAVKKIRALRGKFGKWIDGMRATGDGETAQ